MSRVTSGSQRVGELVSWGFLDMTWAVTNIGVAIVFMLFINWQLALIHYRHHSDSGDRRGQV